MSASQSAYFNLQEFSDAGVLLLGGRLYTYAQGTTAFKAAYTDPAGAVPQTYTADGLGGQYIALNARGELPAPLYLATGSYDIALKRADGSTVWTRRADAIDNGLGGYIASIASSIGSSLIGFIQAGVGAVLRTVQDKLYESVSVFDFMTPAEIADVKAGTALVDVTTALQTAINAVQLKNGTLLLPPGVYRTTATIVISKRIILRGSGMGSPTTGAVDSAGTIIKKTADCIGIQINSGANFATLEDFALFGTVATGTASGIQNGQTDATNGAGGTTFKNLWIQGHKGLGLNITNGNSGRIDRVYCQSNGSHGLNISSTHTVVDNTNAWVITGITAIGNTGNGVHIDKASSNTIIGMDCEGNTGYGLYINRPYNFVNGYVENNTAGPLSMPISAFNCVLFLRSVAGAPSVANINNYVHMLDGAGKAPYLTNLGNMTYKAAVIQNRVDVPYSGFMAMQSRDANQFTITVTNGGGMTIGNFGDSGFTIGERITITFVNASGGVMGAVTWGGTFKLAAFTNPANGFSRSIDFCNNGTNWVEVSRTPADVPN